MHMRMYLLLAVTRGQEEAASATRPYVQDTISRRPWERAEEAGVALLVVGMALVLEEALAFKDGVAAGALEALGVPWLAKGSQLWADDGQAACVALGPVKLHVAVLAVRIALDGEERLGSGDRLVFFVFEGMLARCRGGLAGVDERVAAIGAEKVQVVVVPLLLAGELRIVNGNEARIDNWRLAMKAALAEQLMVVDMAVRQPLVHIEAHVLQPRPAVRTTETFGVP